MTHLTHLKYLTSTELPSLFEGYDDSQQLIKIHYVPVDRFNYLFLHRSIYDRFLSRFSNLVNSGYTFINSPKKTTALFLCYLYLRQAGQITDRGCLTGGVYQASSDADQLTSLAAYYDLPWLSALCLTIYTQHKVLSGPLFWRGDQLMLAAAPDEVVSVGAPPHTKALTTTANGHVWFAVCHPAPSTLQLWVRKTSVNHWSRVTEVVDPALKHSGVLDFFQLSLAEKQYLYLLINKKTLYCYNLVDQVWLKICHLFACNTKNYLLAETGDESLPAILLAEDQVDKVLTLNSTADTWLWPKNNSNRHLLYDSDQLTTIGASKLNWDFNPLYELQAHFNDIYDVCPHNGMLLLAQLYQDDDAVNLHPPVKKLKIHNVPEGLQTLRVTQRTPPVLTTTCASADTPALCYPETWRKLLVYNKGLYGQRHTGEWWHNQLSYGVHQRLREWTRVSSSPNPKNKLVYNPLTETLSRVGLKDNVMTLDSQTYVLDTFNPNFSDYAFLAVIDAEGQLLDARFKSGLESLTHVQIDSKDHRKFIYETPSEVPPALNLLLHSLTNNMSQKLKEGLQINYLNGGVRIAARDLLTGLPAVELYVTEPPSTHRVLKANLQALLKRYTDTEPYVLIGMGSLVKNSTPTIYVPNKHNYFKYVKESDVIADRA
nr:ORF130A [Acipenserid herpesvirus 1]